MPTVLVVEDDEDTRANLCDLLELDDFDVSVASTAREAKELLRAKPHVAILDRKLPDGLAEDLLPELREISSNTEFIVVTGYADMESAIAAMRNGASDYLLKPIQPESFRGRLQRITEVKQLEDELQREHEFAEQILSTAEAVVLVLNLDGTVQHYNPFLTELTGWHLDEVKSKDWFEVFIPKHDRERIRQIFLATAEGADTQGVINPILTRKGRKRVVRWSNTTLKDSAGKATSVLSVGLDVTDLAETQERALRAERLATIGQMMAALAHESRNALQRIQASTDLLGLEIAPGTPAEDDLSKIRRAANDLNVLLEEVRAFAAPIQLRREMVGLVEVVNQAWGNLEQQRAKQPAMLEIEDSLSSLELNLDIVRMEQVFRNLFENSMAASDEPVQIRVGIEQVLSENRLANEHARTIDLKRGDHIAIFVQDNGPGLSEEQAEKVFDAFFTTKDAGTGLGMAIVQRILEAHGGTIAVDKDCEKGARFVLSLVHQ